MVERTGEKNSENFSNPNFSLKNLDEKRMFVSILNDVVVLVDKIVVNENDRARLVDELKKLDNKAEESIMKGLNQLGDECVDR